MKPFSPARIATTIARLKQKAESAPANLDGLLKALADATKGAREYLRWVTASSGSEIRLITVEEISFFRSDNKYTLVATAGGDSLIRRPIKELIAELDPEVFWQIHRSTLVNVNAIAGIHRDVGGHLSIKLKHRRETLMVSTPYVHLFRQM
jgi:DNA-binding LytR/AlgR family response regulator